MEGAFKGMAHLLKVCLPSSLKSIGATAFKGCRQLKEINFPEQKLRIPEEIERVHRLLRAYGN